MNEFDIFADIKNNKIFFYLNIPFEFDEKYEEEAWDYLNEPFYESEFENIDFNEFINILKNKLKIENINFDNILKEKEIIFNSISADNIENLLKFVKTHKNLKYKIWIEDYKSFIEKFKVEEDNNILIRFKNSTEELTYKEFFELFNYLNEIVEFVNYYNLSPLEKIMLTYDIVKSNIYNSEGENESYDESRNLNRIIKNDKIVCVGFANLLDFLLTNLKFKTGISSVYYIDKDDGHERNYVYLKDSKYDIDGIFFLDATWDSKRNEKYLDNYKYFLKPLIYFKSIRKNERQENLKMTDILTNKVTLLEELKEKIKNDKFKTTISLNGLINFNEDEDVQRKISFNMSEKELEEATKLLIKKYYRKIDHESFKNALYKVRKIEYINKIINQMPTEQYIDDICSKYYNENAFLAMIFGDSIKPTLNKDLNETNSTSINQDLLKAKLLRVLKEVINDFPNNDYIKKM